MWNDNDMIMIVIMNDEDQSINNDDINENGNMKCVIMWR